MGYAKVNGLPLYYAEFGSGEPLILLHGGFGTGETFGPLLPALAEHRRVIAVDLQGHGRTADTDRPLRPELMADDIAGLIQDLGLPGVDLVGYSLGGAVAQRTAIQHPELVRRLVLISSVPRRSAWHADSLAAMDQMGAHLAEPLKQAPMYQVYAQVAPDPEHWPVLVGKMGDFLRYDFDWSAEVTGITAPTLLVFADADAIRPEAIVDFYALLGGGQHDAGADGSARSVARLAILPGTTHYDITLAPGLAAAIAPFLAAPATPMPARTA